MLNPIYAPKAKPVKIRIMSGGEEHSSLDSLRHNFDLEDVERLLDGRLVNWLNKIEEPELARKVSELQQTKTEVSLNDENFSMSLIHLFFPDTHAETLKDVANEWVKDNVYKDNAMYLYKQLVWNDVDLAIALYKGHSFNFNWKDVFKHHYCNCTEQDLFRLGKDLYENNDTEEYKNLGERMIKKAAGLEYKAAVEYIEEATPIEPQDAIVKRRKKNGYNEKTQKGIQEMIRIWRECETANQPFAFSNLTATFRGGKIRDIREFMEQILICYSGTQSNQNHIYHFHQQLGQIWKKQGIFDKTDPYYKEKALILILSYLVGSNRKINRTNTEDAILLLALDCTKLESYPLYQCIVGEDVSSILSPADIDFLTSPIGILIKIITVFEHIMDF